MGRHRLGRSILRAAAPGLVIFLAPEPVLAGITGKISGRVLDKQKRPVVAATVAVAGQPFGAYSDSEGQYSILNVPPGTYVVNVNRIGYKALVVEKLVVSADQTTRLDVELDETRLETETVVVTAERPPIDINLTSSRTTLSSEEIALLPVQELQDVVNLQAGVVDGHFRGGRIGEVQYQIDGVSVNNAYDNVSSLRVDRSLLQEVQVVSGTFDAEYGQAMSGVVNAVLRQGTPRFQWSAEFFTGGFFFPGNGSDRLTDDTLQPGAAQNYQLTLSGPLPFADTVYLLSGRYYTFDDFIRGTRLFLPTDRYDPEEQIYTPSGDGEEVPLAQSREWSGALKLTNTSIPAVKLNYQALFDILDGRRDNFAFRLNPDGLSSQQTFSIAHGFDWTQTLSRSTFLDVNLRQNYLHYEDQVYDDVFDPRYDAAGPPVGDPNYEDGAYVQGVEFTRFEQETNAYLLKGTVVSQATREHQLKGGVELQLPTVRFGTTGHLVYTTASGEQTLVRYLDSPPDYPGVREYEPVVMAGFAQDQVEWRDLTLRAGLRLDYFDARATVPSDPANPANAIAGAPQSVPQPTSVKVIAAPRLGVAYPITDEAAIHFAYGHFYQFPPIGQIFANADYSVLARLQAGGVSYGVLGNPDVRPEKSIQYEFGYKQAIGHHFGFDLSAFYKDIRDLLGVEFITTYNDAEYARLTNADFGNVIGFTVAMDHRQLGPVSLGLDYTWQQAQGNSSDPRETATRAEAGEDPQPRVVPFNWDQRHTFNMTVALAKPEVYSLGAVIRAVSGQPYTPVLEAGFGSGLEPNSGRKPAGVVVDLRADRKLGLGGLGASVFARVFNLFDALYFSGPVFDSTGSPYYSRFPTRDEVALQDPTRFYPPRRIEVGITLAR